MKLSHIGKARRIYREMKRNAEYSDLVEEYSGKIINGRRILEPRANYWLGFFHIHRNGIPFYDLAKRIREIGGDFVVLANHEWDENQKSKERFEDDEVAKFFEIDGKIIIIIKGLECNLKDEDYNHILSNKGKKIIIAGYRGRIKPNRNLEEVIDSCKKNGGIVLASACFNEGSRGLDRESLDRHFDDIDAIGILDSAFGLGFLRLSQLHYSDILAKHYALGNNSRGERKAMFSEGNAHTLSEIGFAGDYFRRDYLSSLSSIEELKKEPQRLIEEIKRAFKDSARFPNEEIVINSGNYLPPWMIFDPKRICVVFEEFAESCERKAQKIKKFLEKRRREVK